MRALEEDVRGVLLVNGLGEVSLRFRVFFWMGKFDGMLWG